MTATAVARDARPPLLLVRVMNPVLRTALRTPLGRLVRRFALLEFRGRRTGRRYRVPVGWHDIGREHAVVTPARWRVNFRDGRPVTVHHRGRRRELTGTLEADAAIVASALQAIVDRTGSLASVGVAVPPRHHVSVEDVIAVDRALVRFVPVP